MPYFHAVAPAAASQDISTASRIGVLLVNLGTPDAPTYFAVQRYLREFLSDRRVIDTSRLHLAAASLRCGAAIAAAAHGAQLSQDLDEGRFTAGRVFEAARRQDRFIVECGNSMTGFISNWR